MGQIVNGVMTNIRDFWRNATGGVPDGNSDTTELVYHAGPVGVGSGQGGLPAYYPAILSYSSTNTVKTQLIRTKITTTSNRMVNLRLHGYAYGNAKTVDVLLGVYLTTAPDIFNATVTTMGTEVVESVRFGLDAGELVIEVNWRGAGIYYNRYQVDAYISGPDGTLPTTFAGWTITEAGLPGTTTLITTPTVYGSSYPLYETVAVSPNANSTAIGVDINGMVQKTCTLGIRDNRSVNGLPNQYPLGITYELKFTASIGIGTGFGAGAAQQYADVVTYRRWPDISDGLGTSQEARIRVTNGTRVLRRVQTTLTTWGTWQVTAESSPRALPQYTSVAAATADASLTSGSAYRITGDGTIRSKN